MNQSKFDTILEYILQEEIEPDFKSAVAIVQQRDRWLLGLSKANDDRKTKWCHVGGRIKKGETPQKAAERECFEESGIRCNAVGKPFRSQAHKGVAFVHCKVASINQKLDPNEEFSAVGFFTTSELRTLKPLYKNVRELIDRAKR